MLCEKNFFPENSSGGVLSHQPFMIQMSNLTFFYNTRCTTLHKSANKCLISALVFSGRSDKKRQKFGCWCNFFCLYCNSSLSDPELESKSFQVWLWAKVSAPAPKICWPFHEPTESCQKVLGTCKWDTFSNFCI
jgi:hypothetical protein